MSSTNIQDSTPHNIVENQETFQGLMMKAMGQPEYTPTEKQIDKVLKLREKGMDYTHQERTKYLPKDILELILKILVLLVFLAIFIAVLFKASDYIDTVIAAFVSLIGGYGLGRSGVFTKQDSEKQE